MVLHLWQTQCLRELNFGVVDHHRFLLVHNGIVVHWRRSPLTLAHRVCCQQPQLLPQFPVTVINPLKSLGRNTSIETKVHQIALFGILDLFLELLGFGHSTLQNHINILIGNGRFIRPKYFVGSKSDCSHDLFFGNLIFVFETALLDNHGIKFEFLLSPLNYLFFDSVFAYQTVDTDGLFLAQSMATILGLQILLGIPIRIVQDANVCRLEIDSEPSGTSRQNETKLFAVWCIEGVDGLLSIFVCSVSIDPTIFVSSHDHEIFQNIQNTGHLCENKDAALSLFEAL
mmetsp:Transcript_27083/g.59561  ORF Transcript_27083/g.59561 Transcript_27083/m.59561 type:complete len:286 (+) Transcript_27083:2321-3178(+)